MGSNFYIIHNAQMGMLNKLLMNNVDSNISWLKDESIVDLENLLDPDTVAHNISENLEVSLKQFRSIKRFKIKGD